MVNKRAILAWSFYDWANSAFPTVIITFIFATYFTEVVAPNKIIGTQLWGYTIALSGFIIAILAPLIGAIADKQGRCKIWIGFFTFLLIISCLLLWYAKPHSTKTVIFWILACIIIADISFEIATVFYNAMLKNLAPPSHVGRISGWAWGLGYAGGLACLTLSLVLFVKGNIFNLDTQAAHQIRINGPLVAIWLGIFSLPLFLLVPDTQKTDITLRSAARGGVKQLISTLRKLFQHSHTNIVWFLLAHMLYIDGLNTLFAFGGIYAAGTFGMSFSEIIVFGIALNITAGLGAACFAWLDDYLGPKRTILLAIAGLVIAGSLALWVHHVGIFWILAMLLGLFVGPVQAASRSLMARVAPKEMVNELFGLYSLSGKITAFIGPWLVGLVTFHFNSQRLGMAVTVLLMMIGGFMLASKVTCPRRTGTS